jgi:hypothetical protein
MPVRAPKSSFQRFLSPLTFLRVYNSALSPPTLATWSCMLYFYFPFSIGQRAGKVFISAASDVLSPLTRDKSHVCNLGSVWSNCLVILLMLINARAKTCH